MQFSPLCVLLLVAFAQAKYGHHEYGHEHGHHGHHGHHHHHGHYEPSYPHVGYAVAKVPAVAKAVVDYHVRKSKYSGRNFWFSVFGSAVENNYGFPQNNNFYFGDWNKLFRIVLTLRINFEQVEI